MRQNLETTHGLLFADAVAGRLAPTLGRAEAHHLVEQAADAVRRSGRSLRDVLSERPEVPEAVLDAAFDLSPALAAAQPWIDRALAHAGTVLDSLATDEASDAAR
jgi:3-carboxy-cis,cis-muconate cycloisomerase